MKTMKPHSKRVKKLGPRCQPLSPIPYFEFFSILPDELLDMNYTSLLGKYKKKLHSKRVKMKTTLETSENENYTRNE
jgi:hypothetical protein